MREGQWRLLVGAYPPVVRALPIDGGSEQVRASCPDLLCGNLNWLAIYRPNDAAGLRRNCVTHMRIS